MILDVFGILTISRIAVATPSSFVFPVVLPPWSLLESAKPVPDNGALPPCPSTSFYSFLQFGSVGNSSAYPSPHSSLLLFPPVTYLLSAGRFKSPSFRTNSFVLLSPYLLLRLCSCICYEASLGFRRIGCSTAYTLSPSESIFGFGS
jgi:hypothetical protein